MLEKAVAIETDVEDIMYIVGPGGDVASTLVMDAGFSWGVSVLFSTLLSNSIVCNY